MFYKRSSPTRTAIALTVVLFFVALAAFPGGTRAEPTDGGLSCRDGLALHLYAPQSPEATPLRTRSGLELRASKRLLTITRSLVKEAYIWEYRGRLGSRIGDQRPAIEKPFFSVTLQLNGTGIQQLGRALPDPAGTDLVVVCNDTVLRAQVAHYDNVSGVDVFIDQPSAQAAEAFARSFTPNVRFERRTPAAE